MIRFLILLSLSFYSLLAVAQQPLTQQLRGTVIDQLLQRPLVGATVRLPGQSQTVITDAEGGFRFTSLPIGSYRVEVSYAGYKEVILENVFLNTGKETVLQIAMETAIHTEAEVVVKANSRKNKPLNEMSLVSARAFSVEETQRYAAAVNDPLRMAMAFPGVVGADDGNNQIVIRGNSPAGLLWRMEGLDIPNPNHFSSVGTSGGGISILSTQLLANSDFVTGAFASEYGNALSGVFDLRLRKGNNEKPEYTLQAGVLGLNAAAEGPFSKKYKGSYLINYRYSTLNVLSKLGLLPDETATNFQDLSYHIYLPAGKWGQFSLFGFGGLSDDKDKAKTDSADWESKWDRYTSKFLSNTFMNGLNHTIQLGAKSSLRTGIGYSSTRNAYDQWLMNDQYKLDRDYKDDHRTRKLQLNSTFNHRFSNKLQLRAGLIAQLIRYNYYMLGREHEDEPLEEVIRSRGNTSLQQAYAQLQYKLTDHLLLNGGLHWLHLSLNNTSAIDPRFSVRWAINPGSSISLGYGHHSQIQTMGIYFSKQQQPDGSDKFLNKNLGFTKAHHYVLSYSQRVSPVLLLKTELYLQQLYNAPVSTETGSTFSTLNVIEDFINDPLVNKGKGRNYGVEISAERYLRNNFYFTVSQSLYQSKYRALDGVERNTRFNGNYITTFIIGKEFETYRRTRSFGINLKTIWAGGQRTTPINVEESQAKGYTVFDEQRAYSLQNPDYFRTDLRLSMKWNRKGFTSTLSLDLQNVTNRLNVFNQWFDSQKGEVTTNYQTGLIPVLNYKIEF